LIQSGKWGKEVSAKVVCVLVLFLWSGVFVNILSTSPEIASYFDLSKAVLV